MASPEVSVSAKKLRSDTGGGFQAGANYCGQKRPYSPDHSVKFRASALSGSEALSQQKSPGKDDRMAGDAGANGDFPVDSSARTYSTFDCSKSGGFCSSAYQLAACQQDTSMQNIKGFENGGSTVPLNFDEFYCLMKLKIGYQRKKVSQVMMKESEKLAHPDSVSNRFSSHGPDGVPSVKNSKGPKSIVKGKKDAFDGDMLDSSQDEVLVENRQETVSCIFYPYKH